LYKKILDKDCRIKRIFLKLLIFNKVDYCKENFIMLQLIIKLLNIYLITLKYSKNNNLNQTLDMSR
jgi:hypothetical protein